MVLLLVAVTAVAGGGVRGVAGLPQAAMFWLLMAVAHACFAVISGQVARIGPVAGRRLWRSFAAAGTAFLAGDLAQLVAVARAPLAPTSLLGTGLLYGSVAVGMAAVWALAVAVLVAGGLDARAWVVGVGAMVTTVLVIGRQLNALRHITELLRERDELTARLTELAYHDALTGLANRGLFLRRLHEALAAGLVTVFLIDLDDFKPVNDAFGHATGDQLLIEVARRLRTGVRAGDTVARLGGDEFAVLMTGLSVARGVEVTRELAGALHGIVRIGSADVVLRASVGMAAGRHGEHDPDSLLHAADMAMYAAKEARRELVGSDLR